MTLHFDSWQTFVSAIVSLSALISLLAGLHWKLFAAPLLKKTLTPYGERLDAVTHVVRMKFPQEYRDAMANIQDERPLRSAI